MIGSALMAEVELEGRMGSLNEGTGGRWRHWGNVEMIPDAREER